MQFVNLFYTDIDRFVSTAHSRTLSKLNLSGCK